MVITHYQMVISENKFYCIGKVLKNDAFWVSGKIHHCVNEEGQM